MRNIGSFEVTENELCLATTYEKKLGKIILPDLKYCAKNGSWDVYVDIEDINHIMTPGALLLFHEQHDDILFASEDYTQYKLQWKDSLEIFSAAAKIGQKIRERMNKEGLSYLCLDYGLSIKARGGTWPVEMVYREQQAVAGRIPLIERHLPPVEPEPQYNNDDWYEYDNLYYDADE